jgi:hypothetical protein
MTREEEIIKTSIEQGINSLIKKSEGNIDTNIISDGYHTFGELYDHRIALYKTMAWYYSFEHENDLWKSKVHSDGTSWVGWFIAGIFKEPGKQISYHIPMSKWGEFDFFQTLDQAPDFDGHTSEQVLERISNL